MFPLILGDEMTITITEIDGMYWVYFDSTKIGIWSYIGGALEAIHHEIELRSKY